MLRGEFKLHVTAEHDSDAQTLAGAVSSLMTTPYVVLRAICMGIKNPGECAFTADMVMTGAPILSPVMLTFYALRHVRSSLLMPNMKRGRGYTHWNPDNVEATQELYSAMQTPRLLTTKKQAQRCRQLWAQYPCAFTVRYEQSMWSDEGGGEDFRTKPDGRKLDDLEIVAVHVIVNDVKESL